MTTNLKTLIYVIKMRHHSSVSVPQARESDVPPLQKRSPEKPLMIKKLLNSCHYSRYAGRKLRDRKYKKISREKRMVSYWLIVDNFIHAI
jgi:hypothetical protein